MKKIISTKRVVPRVPVGEWKMIDGKMCWVRSWGDYREDVIIPKDIEFSKRIGFGFGGNSAAGAEVKRKDRGHGSFKDEA